MVASAAQMDTPDGTPRRATAAGHWLRWPTVQAQRWLYDALYRTGLARTMWDRDTPDEALVRWCDDAPPGRALDIGCGTGTHAVFLASRGRGVDAIDFSAPAVEATARRAGDARVDVTSLQADVFRYDAPPYALVVDYGCMHNLDPETRAAYASRVAALTAPGGLFVLMALAPRWRVVDWRVLGPHHIPARVVGALFERDFTLEDSAEVAHYWEHAPRVYRPLSGPYQGRAYKLRRRG